MYTKNGTIKYPGNKIMQTQYGPRKSLVVTMEDNSEERIFYEPGRMPHDNLQKGAAVQILFEQNQYGKQTRKLSVPGGGYQQVNVQPIHNYSGQPPQQQYQPPQQQYQPKPPPQPEKPMFEYISELAVVMDKCINEIYGLAKEAKDSDERTFYDEATSEDIRAMGISLFIQVQRKYGL